MLMPRIEPWLLRVPRGAMSRLRLLVYRVLGMRQGSKNRMEGRGRVRRCSQIAVGDNNAFTEGCWLWPEDTDFAGVRIRIGNSNYFNRNVMIDACGSVGGDKTCLVRMYMSPTAITNSMVALPPANSRWTEAASVLVTGAGSVRER